MHKTIKGYVLPLILCGIGLIMPKNELISQLIGYVFIGSGIVVFLFTHKNKMLSLVNIRNKVQIELATGGRYSERPKINIIITNKRKLPITVVRILIRETDENLIELSTQSFDLPQTIKFRDHISLPSPYIAHNIAKIYEIYAEDTLGNRWKVNKKSFEQAKKLIKNIIGGLHFPSMEDEINEEKIN